MEFIQTFKESKRKMIYNTTLSASFWNVASFMETVNLNCEKCSEESFLLIQVLPVVREIEALSRSETAMAQGWIVDGGDEDVETNVEDVMELYEEEFVLDEEEEHIMDFEFKSDTDEVMEKYDDKHEKLEV
ncbi:uncharacterized protein [Henckelia pumila]|uniref:uncharacterized protein n=1 Tax=Henckelia pumila TaxID=405737 RepID=UPI003C6DBECE